MTRQSVHDDTISSISTPAGEGAIGIVRISGSSAVTIASRMFFPKKYNSLEDVPSGCIVYGEIRSLQSGETIDEVLVSVMRTPNSYTREDTVEINCHGGPLPLKVILDLTLKAGARLAQPGEFTKRAFVNGRIDLVQTEAVIDLIRARTEAGLVLANAQLKGVLSSRLEKNRETLTRLLMLVESAIDFSEEEDIQLVDPQAAVADVDMLIKDIEELLESCASGRIIREGACVSIIGRPNVGKSSIMNAIMGCDKAIVTSHPGTTRDVIADYVQIAGIPVRFTDTAGIRSPQDPIEEEGIRRTREEISGARLVLFVVESSENLCEEDIEIAASLKEKRVLCALNKSDLPSRIEKPRLAAILPGVEMVSVCAKNGEGISALKTAVHDELMQKNTATSVVVTNARHEAVLKETKKALELAREGLIDEKTEELLAFHLREALDFIGEITGETTPEDILNKIFGNFCIGK